MIYALLVGINNYQDPKIPDLGGCVGDSQRIQAFLQTFTQQRSIGFAYKFLHNQAAHREALLSELSTFFSKAGPEDIALFYFSGHGSYELSPSDPHFYLDNGGPTHETICPYDSNYERGEAKVWDIADKELRLLIHRIGSQNQGEQGPEVITIFDSCHSGSATRHKFVPGTSKEKNPDSPPSLRPVDSFIQGVFIHGKYALPPKDEGPRRIHFAACSHNERAWEGRLIENGKETRSGYFTRALLDALQKTQTEISYQNLQHACISAVHNRWKIDTQHPRIDVSGGISLHQNFLIPSRQSQYPRGGNSHLHFFNFQQNKEGEWTVNIGAVHGMQTQKKASFNIYKSVQDGGDFIGTASTRRILLNESICDFTAKKSIPSASDMLRALPQRLPLHKYNVYLQGDRSDFTRLPSNFLGQRSGHIDVWMFREEVEHSLNIGTPFPHENVDEEKVVRVSEQEATVALYIDEEYYRLRYTETGLPLPLPPEALQIKRFEEGSKTSRMGTISKLLLHLATYERLRQLQNPTCSITGEEARGLKVVVESPTREELKHSLTYGPETSFDTKIQLSLDVDQREESSPLRIKLINESDRRFYVVGVYQSPDYSSLEMSNEEVKSGASLRVDEKGFQLSNFEKESPHQASHHYTLIISTREIPFLHTASSHSLSELYEQIMDTMRSNYEEGEQGQEWFCSHIDIKLLLSLGRIGKEALSLAGGKLKIHPHRTFKAKVSLSSSARHFRIPDSDLFIKQQFESRGLELLDFSSGDYTLKETILELHHLENTKELQENPLHLDLYLPGLENGTSLLAVSLPQDIYLPGSNQEDQSMLLPLLGESSWNGQGRYNFNLDHLPPGPEDGRGGERSVKISFVLLPEQQKSRITAAIKDSYLDLGRL